MSLSRAILFPFLIDLFTALSGTVKLVGERCEISNNRAKSLSLISLILV